jgi:hypothetical protein
MIEKYEYWKGAAWIALGVAMISTIMWLDNRAAAKACHQTPECQAKVYDNRSGPTDELNIRVP